MWEFHEGVGWWWVFGSIWMVAVWAGFIWLAVWAVRRLSEGDHSGSHLEPPAPKESPIEIARMRLAKGEITPEQFEELREMFESSGRPTGVH